ncbi:hypothetical protein [Mucilaginibacter segetis]|uniref:Uncharacterized protein n=1 Tax=Mucilaginibacter segetis TaxID=2793071 RepID=A0A934PS82_9SPHI|nr:hypothetical protein [Mucilaginibacter segetis]MBK0379139.1 hypothetical protein [Mucilaginibacter segetis]
MKKPIIVLLLILLSFQVVLSQTKEIKGDTAYWYKRNRAFQRTLKLKDFETSTDEFNFRFSYYGQIIEIKKDSFNINGNITNYIYHTKKANRGKVDTLFSKIILSPEKAKSIYNVIVNSMILILPSDKEIKNWQHGADGITYFVEYSDKKNYWIKNYWTPSAQDSIPEALIVLSFIKKLSDSLNLEVTYKTFKNGLPKQGCYNSGGMTNTCYNSNAFELGYSGATKLPLGFYTSYSASYIGKTKVNSGVVLQYNFDNNNFYHLNFQISKWNILGKESQLSDFIVYNYQNRKLDIDWPNNNFQNHQIVYGLNLKRNFSVRTGLDYLINKNKKLGVYLYASKYLRKPNISTELSSSIFNNQINYKAQIFRSFNLNRILMVNRITLGLAYEEFMHYNDVYFSIRLSL